MASIKYFLAIGASIFFLHKSNAQIIRGQVFNIETDSTIAFANVYFNSSFQGTTTDQNGKFELNTTGYTGQGIVISCIGYESWILEYFEPDKFYKIYLKPSTILLKEILIVADDWPQSKKIKRFIHEFLGTSFNASKCTVENKEDINLVYDKSIKTLKAYCYKPIIIQNKSLGYKITYYLDEFEWNPNNMHYTGNSLFEEDTSLSAEEIVQVINRRKQTFYGSRMHFFRELWKGESAGLEFYVSYKGSNKKINEDMIIDESHEHVKYLCPGKGIVITYQKKTSYIDFKGTNEVLFTGNGYFDPKYILWSGEMANQRVGDLLPYEYWP